MDYQFDFFILASSGMKPMLLIGITEDFRALIVI
jgi:hypothetical protein